MSDKDWMTDEEYLSVLLVAEDLTARELELAQRLEQALNMIADLEEQLGTNQTVDTNPLQRVLEDVDGADTGG